MCSETPLYKSQLDREVYKTIPANQEIFSCPNREIPLYIGVG